MNTNFEIVFSRRWLVAALLGLSLLFTTLANISLATHPDVATEMPPAIADPVIGAGGGGNG